MFGVLKRGNILSQDQLGVLNCATARKPSRENATASRKFSRGKKQMSNTAAVLGVEAVNKVRQADVLAKAQSLINGILANNKAIKCYKETIAEEQKKLAAIADDVVTQASIMGTEFSAPLNPNQLTIVDAIKKINEARQASIALNGQHHSNQILSKQEAIKVIEKSNEDLRKHLSELGVDVVTLTTVVG